jgi:outer membrane lipoprotein-sorting protein
MGAAVMAASVRGGQTYPGRPGTGQSNPPAPQRQEEGRTPTEKESKKARENLEKSKGAVAPPSPVEIIVETTIFAYGGRDALKAARGSIREEGAIKLASDQGEITGTYDLRSIRKEKSWQDLLRTDLELSPPRPAQGAGSPPTIKYVIAFNGASVWAAQNGQYTTLRPDVEAAFRAQLTHDYTTLLRYKEDGSKIELVGPETVVGIETNVVDLTTPDGEKSRYWISSRSYRILHVEYELKLIEGQAPTKYRISYFPPMKVVQNTLVPARRVMRQDGKVVQEITIKDVTYSAKLDPEIFQFLETQ